MIRIIGFILVLLGGTLITYSTWVYWKLVDTRLDNMPRYARHLKRVSLGMMIFFILGYIVGAVDILTGVATPMFYFIGAVFFAGSVFVFLIMQYIRLVTQALKEKHGQIEAHSKGLEAEVERRVKEVLRQDHLLRTANDVASILLGSGVETFDSDLWKCMGMLGESVGVDRVYIWKNHTRDGRLCCTQVYEWSQGAEPQQGMDITIDISYDENIPGWEEKLSKGRSVNGLVRNLSLEEQDQLLPQGIISILVVPVFLQNSFWGFVGFDDCHKEREFLSAEESILRSASLLIATALLRNEMTVSLVQAKEEALASTKAKGTFLSNMSHEIRTPINAISGMALIARKSNSMERMLDCLDKIDAATRQLLAIINDILDMSKIEAGKMELACEVFDLNEALYNVKSIMGVRADEKKQHFTLSIASDVPGAVRGDEIRLSQILINLLSNAVKFTPEEGDIDLSVMLAEKTREAYRIRATVTDSGIGISPEQITRLFQAFEQAEKTTAREFGGTGLGLAISRKIAGLMNGDIFVHSEVGKGSRFTVEIELGLARQEELAQRRTGNASADIDVSGKTVLVVEDIQINREIIQSLLSDLGMKVCCAENGQEAVDMVGENCEDYDMILMDIHMPVMDGYTATRSIRAMNVPRARSIPIVAMTANAFEEDVRKCLAAGMDRHIAKPVDVNQLYQCIGELLNA